MTLMTPDTDFKDVALFDAEYQKQCKIDTRLQQITNNKRSK